MNEELLNENGGNAADTPTADREVDTREEKHTNSDSDFNEIQKTKINDIVRERLAQDRNARLKKYGYTTEDELDVLLKRVKSMMNLKHSMIVC